MRIFLFFLLAIASESSSNVAVIPESKVGERIDYEPNHTEITNIYENEDSSQLKSISSIEPIESKTTLTDTGYSNNPWINHLMQQDSSKNSKIPFGHPNPESTQNGPLIDPLLCSILGEQECLELQKKVDSRRNETGGLQQQNPSHQQPKQQWPPQQPDYPQNPSGSQNPWLCPLVGEKECEELRKNNFEKFEEKNQTQQQTPPQPPQQWPQQPQQQNPSNAGSYNPWLCPNGSDKYCRPEQNWPEQQPPQQSQQPPQQSQQPPQQSQQPPPPKQPQYPEQSNNGSRMCPLPYYPYWYLCTTQTNTVSRPTVRPADQQDVADFLDVRIDVPEGQTNN